MKKKFSAVLISLFAVMLIAVGCGSSTEKAEKPSTYTVADSTGDWGYPSPYAHYSRGPGYIRMSLIFDTLIWKDQDGYIPALARDWSYNENENSYSFTLNKNVKWHDGEEFDASDVVFTFNYIKDHPYQFVNSSNIKKVAAENNYEVKIYLNEAYAPFLSNIAGTLPILPEHIYKGVENPKEFRGEKALVGTGPYMLVDYSREHGSYLYEANDNYYGGNPAVDKLKFVKVSREMSASALKQGDINAADIPPETVNSLKKSNIKVVKSPYQWNAKLLFNHKSEPFSSKKFRHALAYAIDCERIVDVALRGHGAAAGPEMLPPDSPWHNPGCKQYEYDPGKAQEVLKDLGYEKSAEGIFTKDGKQLQLEMLTWPRFSREAGIIKEQLAKIGIEVDIRSMEAKTVDMQVTNWRFEIALTGHGGLGGDPEILNKMFLGKTFHSSRYYENEQLVDLLQKQLHEMDNKKRKKIVYEVQEIYAEELPALSIYHPAWYWGHDGSLPLFYTKGGVAHGIPLPHNKLCFLK